MLSVELMMAPIMRRPSVVGPTSTISTRGDAAATVSKYLVIAGQSASLPSAPILKPKNASGAGTCAADVPASTRRKYSSSVNVRAAVGCGIVLSALEVQCQYESPIPQSLIPSP